MTMITVAGMTFPLCLLLCKIEEQEEHIDTLDYMGIDTSYAEDVLRQLKDALK